MHSAPIIERVASPIVVGSGIAGLSTALHLGRALVVTKTELGSGSSDLAQGGIAAALGPGDSAWAHAADTIAVGAGLVDELVAAVVAGEGPDRIAWLRELGANFDEDATGALRLGLEAGHSHDRIVHADGDATGRAVMEALRAAARSQASIEIVEHTTIVDLARSNGRIVGVVAADRNGATSVWLAPAVILATGGIGRIYAKTTNPGESTGDGLALAARAGAALRDLEFVQFHPTALDGPADPLPLLTEALRGAGALLVDAGGRRFMPSVHPDAELAPRDVVAREVWARSLSGDAFLDLRPIGAPLERRFPTVYASAVEAGHDPLREPLPVTPAAHYHMGGIATDEHGRSSLPGLFACGEVASTGLHGANRLASNSLLEGLVFAARVATAVAAQTPARPGETIEIPRTGATSRTSGDGSIAALRATMWRDVGVVRDAAGLNAALRRIDSLGPELERTVTGRNMAAVARLVATQALARTESRGGHHRRDHPRNRGLGRATVMPSPAATVTVPLRAPAREHVA